MSINNFFKGIKGEASMRHPNGKFEAYVSGVSIEASKDGSRRFLKIEMATTEGKTPDYRVMILSDFDAQRALSDSDWKSKIVKSVEINKGILVKLGLVSNDEVVGYDQDEMIKCYAKLKHRRLKVTIADDLKDPKYQRIYLDELLVEQAVKRDVPEANYIEKIPEFDLNSVPF